MILNRSGTIEDVLAGDARYSIQCARAEDLGAKLPDGCAQMLWMDIPYFGQVSANWDNAWTSAEAFLTWLDEQCWSWKRILAKNGSLYVFASPTMAFFVEAVVRKHFEVLNSIQWAKPGEYAAERYGAENFRRFVPSSERILFCEQLGAESVVVSRDGYAGKVAEARAFVFEPMRAYFDEERKRSGLSSQQIQDGMFARTGVRYTFDRHTFSRSQWEMPTAEQFAAAVDLFNAEGAADGRPYFARGIESLSAEHQEKKGVYERLKASFESMRRPFNLTMDRPTTDTWTYAPPNYYPGRHPCEKPDDMARDCVLDSSNPGDLVVDLFAGSCPSGSAAMALDRRFIGGDADPHWADFGARRAETALATGRTSVKAPKPKSTSQLSLLGDPK